MTLLFFILNIPNAIGKDEDYIGVVYWRGFDIESITGIPESQINNYGMKRCIGRNVFMGLLFHINDSYSRDMTIEMSEVVLLLIMIFIM